MLVSVLLSAYNAAGTLAAAVESIRAQTLRDWELIVVDDGSTDGTRSLLAKINDPRLRVIHNDSNRGLAASLNEAFRASRAELIARMDADDVALPYRLERQVAFLREHPDVDVLGGAAFFIGNDVITTRRERHEVMARRAFTENPFIHPAVMMRRRVLEELGGYDESLRRAQDYDLWLRGVNRFRYHNLTEPLIRYRRPTRATWQASGAAARVVWLNGLRRREPLVGAYAAMRYIVAFVVWRLTAPFRQT